MRALLLSLVLGLLPGAAFAQDDAERAARDPSVQTTAQVIVQALAPSDYGNGAYHWGVLSIRVSRFMHWHLPDPDDRDRPPDAILERTGWIGEQGTLVGVTARGLDDRVLSLEFDLSGLYVLHVTQALEAQGVEVSFVGDDESSSEYVITPPGRESGQLVSRRVCTPEGSRAARACRTTLTLAFEAP